MSYNNKLEQTGKKVASARRKYYGSFDYGSGLSVGKKGGSFSFGKRYDIGGILDKYKGDNLFFDNSEVAEPELDAAKVGKLEGVLGMGATGLGIIGSGVKEAQGIQNNGSAISKKINNFGTGEFSGITDNSTLLSTMANTGLLSIPQDTDLRNKSVWDDAKSAISAGISGVKFTGSPWGALFGVADAAKSIGERFYAKSKADSLAEQAKAKNAEFLQSMRTTADDVDSRNDWLRMYSDFNMPFEYALGGPLHSNGGDYNGGLTYINEGGRHEENPYEGVPSGVDANGIPNLVEEGEVIWNNDYVFSDRLEIPSDLKEKYKLGKGSKKVTFADAVTKLTKENNLSPNDPITIDTTKAIVEEFMQAQEAIRGQEQAKAKQVYESAMADDFLSQLDALGVPSQGQGMNIPQMGMGMPNEAPVTEGEMLPPGMAFGGHKFEDAGSKKGNRFWDDLISELEGYKGSINNSSLSGRYSIDKNFNLGDFKSIEELENNDAYKAFTDYVVSHSDDADVQRYLKTLDARTGSKSKKLFENGKLRKDWETLYKNRRNDHLGGAYHFYGDLSSPLIEPAKVVANQLELDAKESLPAKVTDDSLKTLADALMQSKIKKNTPAQPENNTQESNFKYRPTWQRQVPVIGSAMAALYGMFNRPDYANADAVIDAAQKIGTPVNIPVETIGDYRQRNPYDERYLVNMANQNRAAGVRTMTNTSGGNRAMDMLGAATLAHSNQTDLGEIMRQAYLANRQDDAQVAEFNRGTNLYNMQAINQRNLSQAQLNSNRQEAALRGLSSGYSMRQGIKDTWDNATMESLNSALASMGAIGKENEDYNRLTSMAEQGYYPYYYGDKGIMQLVKKSAKKGGKLNRKKRRF